MLQLYLERIQASALMGVGSWPCLEVIGPGERSQASLVLDQYFEYVLNSDNQLCQLPLQ